ncbi:MAG: phosphatase PAP2 family protein [Bdellovibrio sp.]
MNLLIKSGFGLFAIGFWLFSQKLLGRRNEAFAGAKTINDNLHIITDKINLYLNENFRAARWLLISSSFLIDGLGIYIITSALLGPSIRPLLGLFLLFGLRQINQAITILPTPERMIWKNPGVPSLFVTYGVSNDLFFSGHTALAVYGALELASLGGWFFLTLGIFIILYEIITVILLRAHWTMDVFAGAITALWIFDISSRLSPTVDTWLSRLH